MNGKNAWFLITSEEIEQIRNDLLEVRADNPGNRSRVRHILDTIDRVRGRLA